MLVLYGRSRPEEQLSILKLLKLMADAAHGPEEQPQHGSPPPEYEGDKSQLAHLGRLAGADYFMLSDQDDVWMPQKARMLSDKMKEMERKPGRGNVPLWAFRPDRGG